MQRNHPAISFSHSATADVHPLLALLEEQHVMLDRLAELTRSQSTCIAERRIDFLLDLLAQRQSLIDEFTKSQTRLTELTRCMDSQLKGVSVEMRDRIKALLNGIGERLSEVMHRDSQDQDSLRAGKQQVAEEMTEMNAAKKARHAYSGARTGPRFSDDRA